MNSKFVGSWRSKAIVGAGFSLREKGHSGPVACLIALSTILALTSIPSSAQQAHPSEFQVKAAYLYNFGKFVSWRNDRVTKSTSLEICVLGKDPFGAFLDSTVAGETIDGRRVAVRRLSKVEEAVRCSILFISLSEESRLGSILVAVQSLSVLTVSDMPRFSEKGGMIGFVTQEDRIRFEVNRGAAERSHVAFSSELLKVATKVIENVPGS